MRRKPNVAAYGEVIAVKKTKVARVQGTSFSTPLVAGFAACVMQLNPELSNIEIFKLVEQSGHLYPYYDYAHGYGIPQASYFFEDSVNNCQETLKLQFFSDTIKVLINKDIDLTNNTSSNLLYFHLENEKGVLERYSVVEASQHEVIDFLINGILDDKILRVHFKGYTAEHKF
jgi:hypothetical protein